MGDGSGFDRVKDLTTLKKELDASRTKTKGLSSAVEKADFWSRAPEIIEALTQEAHHLCSIKKRIGFM